MPTEYQSFGDRVEIFNCSVDMVRDLTRAEVNALHHYKVEFAKNLFKLYETMSPEAADDFVGVLMKRLAG